MMNFISRGIFTALFLTLIFITSCASTPKSSSINVPIPEHLKGDVAEAEVPQAVFKATEVRSIVIPGTWTWDVERDQLGPSDSRKDFWWRANSKTHRELVVKNGTTMKLVKGVSFDKIDIAFIKSQELSTMSLTGDDEWPELTPGSIVVFKTGAGNYGKFQVERYRSMHDWDYPDSAQFVSKRHIKWLLSRPDVKKNKLELRWQLYFKPFKGEPFKVEGVKDTARQSDFKATDVKSTVIPGTYTWDVERNRIAGSDPRTDFWWKAARTHRELIPKNGTTMGMFYGMDFDDIGLDVIMSQKLSTMSLTGDDEWPELTPGSIVVFKTGAGNYGKFQVERYMSMHDWDYPGGDQVVSKKRIESMRSKPDIKRSKLQVRWQLFRKH
jgi:hypothetical protein